MFFLFKKLNLDGRQIFSEKIIINNMLPDIFQILATILGRKKESIFVFTKTIHFQFNFDPKHLEKHINRLKKPKK